MNKIFDVVESLFEFLWELLIEPFLGLKKLDDLIFGKDTLWGEELIWRTFVESELQYAYFPGSFVMTIIAGFLILIAVIIAGIRISGATINPASRTALIEFLKDALIVGILLSQLGTVYTLIFQFNSTIVGIFEGPVQEMQTNFDLVSDGVGAAGSILGWIVIQLALLGLLIWANFYYMMRKLTLLILMILGPVMVALYLFPKTKAITAGWFKELVGSVLVQSIHASTIWIIAVIASTQNSYSVATGGFSVAAVILYIIFIPISESIRNLFGLGGGMQGGLAKAGAMFGMAGLAGMYGSVKGALDGKSVGSALQGMYKGAKDRVKGEGSTDKDVKNTIGANTGTDTGTTAKADKMLKAGQILGKTGKMTAGMAGSIAGSVMGPMGAIAMGTIGGELGEKAGGLAGRMGAAGAQGIASRLGKGKEGALKSLDKQKEKDKDKAMIDSLTEDESTKWANDNKEDFMKDLKEKFPDATQADLDKRWNDELQQRRGGFREKAEQKWNKAKESNGKYADANNLKESLSKDMTSAWAEQNQAQFMEDFTKNNPPEKPFEQMNEAEKVDYENKKIDAWNKRVGQKKAQFQKAGEDTANAMVKNQDHNLVNKQDFASSMVDKALGLEKEDLKQSMNLNNDEAAKEFDLTKDARQKALVKISQKSLNSLPTVKNTENGSAGELGSAIATEMTNDWAGKNKDAFLNQYESNNPPKENMTQEEREAYNNNREQAWSKRVAGKKATFEKAATQTIAEFGGNSGSVVSKADFSSKMVDNAMAQEKAAYISDNADKLGGVDKAEAAFEATKGERQQALIKSATHSVGSVKSISLGNVTEGATGKAIANQMSQDMTNSWSSQNKDQFMQNYESANPPNPNMSPSEAKIYEADKQNSWKQVVQGKKQQFSQAANEVVAQMTNGNPSAVVDKNQFADAMVDKAMNIEKAGVSDISTSSIGFEIDYGKQASERKKVYANAAQSSINGVESVQIFNKSGAVNSNFLASQLASAEVATEKQSFVNDAQSKGLSKNEAIVQWDNQNPGAFEQKYQRIKQNIPDKISSTDIPLMSEGKTVARFVGEASGMNTVLRTMRGIGQGAVSGYTIAAETGENRIVQAVKGSFSGAASGIIRGENAVEKQQNWKDGISYASSVLGGVSGYQVVAKIANKVSPFNNQVKQAIYEPSEVMQMAQTTIDDFGNEKVASGAVRMVTTNNSSHLEVRTKTGESRIVSRYGSGHSGLKKGEVVYQDLDVQNDSFVPTKVNGQSSVYRVDSGGGKIPLDVDLNVDPNRLLTNRLNQKSVSTKQAPMYSQQVDMGNFHLDDAMEKGFENVHVVVERGKSYIAGKQGDQTYRISPIYSGDTRIPDGKTYNVNCDVVNNKLVKGTTVLENSATLGQLQAVEVDYTSSLDPNMMLPIKPNKRLENRRKNEQFRRKQGLLG
ncbi:type IV secretion system protein [Sutcliffiella horikoshii]|uniref:type IV secretion system protein n=1 Tax=Sutcliffiella horikoshii TaxID=79883 RepID=UPI00203BFA2F|nr:type IV secretion system protein [Sutcliffiella horikoshii]MCM3619699.1 type IV secretion system protein [Sutcliffiella horikoshii]